MPLLPADTPRLPKWPFLTGDILLLGIASVIVVHARNPFAGTPLILTVACVAFGAVLAAIPFITDYARKQDEALDERQRALEALARTVAATAEQIGIAAIGLHGIAETATKNAKLAEQLPSHLQEQIESIKRGLAEITAGQAAPTAADTARTGESARLETTADHIRQAATELARLETAAQKNLAAARAALDAKAEQVLAQLDAKISALAALAEKISAPVRPMETTAPLSAFPPKIETPANEPETVVSAPPEHSVTAAEPQEEPKMPRKRAPKKTKTEDPEPSLGLSEAAETTAPPVAPEPPAVQEAAPVASEFSQSSPEDGSPVSSVSADGATRLLVTAYIGIGNRLFIRGEGPGLSWDKGVPLNFVSIGKWRWETADATAPVKAKLYKNDEIECAALGTLTVEPGQQMEVTAAF